MAGGDWQGHWRYRVGAYRNICNIEDRQSLLLVVMIGHRRYDYR